MPTLVSSEVKTFITDKLNGLLDKDLLTINWEALGSRHVSDTLVSDYRLTLSEILSSNEDLTFFWSGINDTNEGTVPVIASITPSDISVQRIGNNLFISPPEDLLEFTSYQNSCGGQINTSLYTNLTSLDVALNDLESVNVIGLSLLTYLDVSNNILTSLDITGLSLLNHLDVAFNDLDSLDVTGSPLLDYLKVNSNNLESIDVTSNDLLTYLNVNSNILTSLDITGLSLLNHLDVSNNNLTEVSIDDILITLNSFGTSGGYLNISGTNNANPTNAGVDAIVDLESRGWQLF